MTLWNCGVKGEEGVGLEIVGLKEKKEWDWK
jgi:hypothetical protein